MVAPAPDRGNKDKRVQLASDTENSTLLMHLLCRLGLRADVQGAMSTEWTAVKMRR